MLHACPRLLDDTQKHGLGEGSYGLILLYIIPTLERLDKAGHMNTCMPVPFIRMLTMPGLTMQQVAVTCSKRELMKCHTLHSCVTAP